MNKYVLILLVLVVNLFAEKIVAQMSPYENACSQQFTKLCADVRRANLQADSSYTEKDSRYYETVKQQDSTEFNIIYQKYFVAFDIIFQKGFGKPEIAKVNEEVKDFMQFVSNKQNGRIENFSIKPIRYSKNSLMLAKLDTYQIDCSFIMFDKTKPDNEIMYLFFLAPVYEAMGGVPKILAVKMAYAYNRAFFIDLLGQMGSEIFFEGPQPPEHPIKL